MATPKDVQDYADVLKQVYLPVRKKAFPLATPLLANATKGSPARVKYSGHDLFFDVKLGRRGGFTASTRGYQPEPGISEEKVGRLGISRTYSSVVLDGLAVNIGNSEKAAYISPAKKAVEDVTEQWQLEQNRILHGDSLAVRAVIDSVTDTDTIIVDNPYGIADAGPGNLHLVAGETISVRSSDGATHRGKAVISSISLSGDLATLELASTIAGMTAGDHVVTGPATATHTTDDSWGAEPFGLKSFVDVEGNFATFQTLKHDRWAALKLTSTGIDELVLMRAMNTVRARSGVDWRANPKAFLLLTTTGIWTQYGASLLGIRRYDAAQLTVKGGFTGVQVGNAVLMDDPWGPRGRLYGVHVPSTVFVDLMDWGEVSYQDAPRWQRVANRDAWEALFASYWNYGLFMRSTHFVISGITDTVNYSPVF